MKTLGLSAFLCVSIHFLVAAVHASDGDTQSAEVAAGHSLHGDVFDEGPRQSAYLMGNTGKVHLAISTKAPSAQQFFDQGVGQLHGFWYFEAERSFRQVAALDPECAMAYWGMAMANVNNKKRAEGFIKNAVAKKDKASPRERQWIAAYSSYWSGKKDEKERRRDLVKALEEITLEFPDEVEAKAFLVYQIWDNGDKGWPLGSRLAVDALMKKVFAKEPLHPAHHYMIHLWDYEKPVRALASAAQCGPSAPVIAHMWHMPTHTYTKVKRYEDAVWQQEAAARTDHRYMMKDGILPNQIHNYTHNNQWLVENFEYLGRAHDAVALAKNLIELPRHPKFNTLGVKADGSPQNKNQASSGEGRRRLLETLLRFELWDELIALADSVYLEPTELPMEQVKRLRALGIACFGKGNLARGAEQIEALERMQTAIRGSRQAAADEAETRAKKERKTAAETAKTMVDALLKFSERLTSIENALAELRGWAGLARGDQGQTKEFFDSARDIPRERLVRIAFELGDREKAIKLAREDVSGGAGQVFRLTTLVEVLHRGGKVEEAKAEFAKLRELAGQADLDVPAMRRLAPLASSLKLPVDWRLPTKLAPDVGERPNLDDLGPIHWQPREAPPWRLPTAQDEEYSSAEHRGKPMIVFFYLGVGCVHCVEQLKTFGPMAKEFGEVGIDLVAISSESLADIKQSAASLKLGAALPMPILADPELNVFKAYRAYDDFEGRPLHGTYLIDGSGRIRWQDVSFEPFTDAKFLLAEARRLLTFPQNQAARQ